MKRTNVLFVILVFVIMFLVFFVAYVVNPLDRQMTAITCAILAATACCLCVIGGYQVGIETAELNGPPISVDDQHFESAFRTGASAACFQIADGTFQYRTREQHELIMQSKGAYK